MKPYDSRYTDSHVFKINNDDVGEKMLARQNQTADELAIRNVHVDKIHERRFSEHRRLVYVSIAVSFFTLFVLLLFTIAFFKYVIIVTN
jgi:hypothetical protein